MGEANFPAVFLKYPDAYERYLVYGNTVIRKSPIEKGG